MNAGENVRATMLIRGPAAACADRVRVCRICMMDHPSQRLGASEALMMVLVQVTPYEETRAERTIAPKFEADT